ncbi:MAG: signal peptidase II [Gemmatimonadales bacterium]|nr:signal peptidase II [Gemmatimonadales bacterium]
MPSGAERRPFWAIMAVVVVLDRITKMIAEPALLGGTVVDVLGEVIRFRLVYNPGAAFGLGQGLGGMSRWIFFVVAAVAVVVLHRMSSEAPVGDRLRQWSLAIVAGGAFGNLIDRIISAPGVVDFIDVGVPGGWRWPTFNVADMAVSCGAVALAISLWLEDRRRAAAGSAAN